MSTSSPLSAGCSSYIASKVLQLSTRKHSNFCEPNSQPGLLIVSRLPDKQCSSLRTEEVVDGGTAGKRSRRELILGSSSVAMLAFLNFRGERPDYIGVQKSVPSLALCPATPTCISTAEELNDPDHYVPPWTYNPEDGRGKRKPASQEKAMQELIDVVENTKPDNYTARIVKKTDDYLYVEYESPFLKFIDDVEFWFPPGNRSICEYRSASRVGNQDFNANRKRIKALRQALEKKGWRSVGY